MNGESEYNDARKDIVLTRDTEINHYRIIDKIGSGGMGDVYLARDTKLEREVALKFLSSQLCRDEECRGRFKREAQAAAKLSHPNIITIHEVSEYKGRPFFAMEYVGGKPLKEYLAEPEMTVDRIVELAQQICEGLQAAHKAGVIHRDIKPSNILVDSSGRARIVDFGLAVPAERAESTKSGRTSGTPLYMSPEQIRGESVGVSSDLFSLGIVLYQMLTGTLPFTGDYLASIAYSILNDDPPPIRDLRPDTPEALQSVVLKLLQKDGSRRFQSATEVLNELHRIAGKETVGGAGLRSPERRISRPAMAIGLVAVLVAVLTVTQMIFDPLGLRTPSRKMLAVLPFENLGSPEDEYFADGMTDAVSLQLARFGELGVISRSSTMRYKASGTTPHQIGNELGASYLLIGTILWDKSDSISKVRVSTDLIRADDGSSVWADSYERVLGKIFDLQSDIARNVTQALKIAVRQAEREELARVPTANMMAYDYYLRGNDYFNRSDEREDLVVAIQLYQSAVQLDSGFAEAFAMLSRALASSYWEYYDRSEDRHRQAFAAAARSLELQPDLVDGHLALGYCYYHCERNYERALVEFELGLQRQPNNAELLNAIAAVKRREGDLETAVRNFVKAMEVDPRSHRRPFDVGLTYGMMRKYQEADKYMARTISLAPDWSLAYIYRAWLCIIQNGDTRRAAQILGEAAGKTDLTRSKYYWWLARLIDKDYQKTLAQINPGPDTASYQLQCAQFYRLMEIHDLSRAYADSARTKLERKLELQPDDPAFLSSLGVAYAYLGAKPQAIATGQKAVELLPMSRDAFDTPFMLVNLAEVLVVCGEHDAAVVQLRHLLSVPGFVSAPYLKLDPLWKPLRQRPDFRALLTEAS